MVNKRHRNKDFNTLSKTQKTNNSPFKRLNHINFYGKAREKPRNSFLTRNRFATEIAAVGSPLTVEELSAKGEAAYDIFRDLSWESRLLDLWTWGHKGWRTGAGCPREKTGEPARFYGRLAGKVETPSPSRKWRVEMQGEMNVPLTFHRWKPSQESRDLQWGSSWRSSGEIRSWALAPLHSARNGLIGSVSKSPHQGLTEQKRLSSRQISEYSLRYCLMTSKYPVLSVFPAGGDRLAFSNCKCSLKTWQQQRKSGSSF